MYPEAYGLVPMKSSPEPLPSPRRSGSAGLTILVVLAVVVLGIGLINSMFSPPSGNKQLQYNNLAYQQQQLASSMTQDAQRAYEAAAATQIAAQNEQQRRQDAINTQSAATAWSLTETPMARQQELQALDLQKRKDEYFYESYLTPLKVFGVFALEMALAIGLLAAVGISFWKLLPVAQARMYVHKEVRGETLIVVKPNQTTKTDLMHRPVLTDQADGTTVASGGAEDDMVQQRIAALALEAKAIRDLPSSVKMPGQKPNVDKSLPDLEVVEGQVIEPKLLIDIKQSLDSGAEVL
jgi:hypothetical protein